MHRAQVRSPALGVGGYARARRRGRRIVRRIGRSVKDGAAHASDAPEDLRRFTDCVTGEDVAKTNTGGRYMLQSVEAMALVRDQGVVVDVSRGICAAERREREDLIGRHMAELWPDRADDWLALDEQALAQRAPLTTLDSHAGRWYRATRIPHGRRIVVLLEDVTAAVKLAALRTVLAVPALATTESPEATQAAKLVMNGIGPRGISASLDCSFNEACGLIMRLIP